ncbi:MAG TPA: glycosyltransferase family 4 protein [Gemmatimonadales bacterium]|nr:glycosyltransferase family 4 protein [Gemmatimonadales bacterium]
MTHNYPRFIGDPAGAFVARIAEGAAAQGHEMEAVAPHAAGTPTDEVMRGVRVHRFRYAPEAFERVAYTGGLHQSTLRSPAAALAFPGFLFAFKRAVRRAVQQLQPHVIHAHWWFPGGWLAVGTRVPYLLTCHGSDVRLLERAPLRMMAAQVFRHAGRITAVSGFLAGDLKRLLADLPEDVTVTPMPIDVAAFEQGAQHRKAAPPRILYAGNLVPSKGVDVLLQAAAELRYLGVEFQLKILGEGPAERSLRSLVARLGLGSRVTWSPFVPQSEMPDEYGASTVTVLPSRGRAEGLGLTLVEALLAGSAVVGTPAGGIPEIVQHEVTGLLARDGDPTDLARQIHRLLTDVTLRDRLVRAGKEHAARVYSPDTTVARFNDIYHAIADDRRRS